MKKILVAILAGFLAGCSVKVTKTETVKPDLSQCKAICCAKGEQELYFRHADGTPSCGCMDRVSWCKGFGQKLSTCDEGVKKYCGDLYVAPKADKEPREPGQRPR
jgi:hypothetical protein